MKFNFINKNDKYNELINLFLNATLYYIEDITKISEEDILKQLKENLKTLKIEYYSGHRRKYEEKEIIYPGSYNAQQNTLKINTEYLDIIVENSKKLGEKKEEYIKSKIFEVLKHEMLHLASTKKIGGILNKKYMSGFDIPSSKKIEDHNRVLTEGITEMLSLYFYLNDENFYDIYDMDYYIELAFARQISLIVGEKSLIKAYFTNDLNLLKDKLSTISKNRIRTNDFFEMLEFNFYNTNKKNGFLEILQDELIKYFITQITTSLENKEITKEEALELIKKYKIHVLKNETLTKFNKPNYNNEFTDKELKNLENYIINSIEIEQKL